jgi:hypothetical protein
MGASGARIQSEAGATLTRRATASTEEPQDHQVTCIIPDAADTDRRIDSIEGSTGAENGGGAWCIKLDAPLKTDDGASGRVLRGIQFWIVIAAINGKKCLKTEADGA